MALFGRYAVAGLVFAGAVGAAGYAASNDEFNDRVTSTVSSLAGNMMLAGDIISGDEHLADPTVDETTGKRDDARIESSSVVTHVEVVGGGAKQRIVLLDPEGREVFTHDPEANTTIIAKDVVIPSVTMRDDPNAIAELRVVTAGTPIEVPDSLVQALNDGAIDQGVFYRDEL